MQPNVYIDVGPGGYITTFTGGFDVDTRMRRVRSRWWTTGFALARTATMRRLRPGAMACYAEVEIVAGPSASGDISIGVIWNGHTSAPGSDHSVMYAGDGDVGIVSVPGGGSGYGSGYSTFAPGDVIGILVRRVEDENRVQFYKNGATAGAEITESDTQTGPLSGVQIAVIARANDIELRLRFDDDELQYLTSTVQPLGRVARVGDVGGYSQASTSFYDASGEGIVVGYGKTLENASATGYSAYATRPPHRTAPQVDAPLRLFAPSPLGPWEEGEAVSEFVRVSGGTPPYSVVGYNGLPTGVTPSMNSAAGKVEYSGTPSATSGSTYSHSLFVRDSAIPPATAAYFQPIVYTSGPFAVSGTLDNITVGSAYSDTLTLSGGFGSRSLYSHNLPAGLSCNIVGNTATISGTPTGAGLGPGTSFNVDLVLTFRDSTSPTPAEVVFEQTITITVTAVVAVFDPSSLLDATVGAAYSADTNASGGTVGHTFTKQAGPTWVSVNSGSGAITGTPAGGDVGTGITITVRATDSEGNYDDVTDTIDVSAVVVYATLDPSNKSSDLTLSSGNMVVTQTSPTGNGSDIVCCTGAAKSTGKAAFEVVATTVATSTFCVAGIVQSGHPVTNAAPGSVANSTAYGYGYYEQTGQQYHNTTLSAFGAAWTTNGDVLYFECDFTAGTMLVKKNNVTQGTMTIQTGIAYFAALAPWRRDAPAHVLTFRSDPSTFTSTQSAGFAGIGWAE